MLRSLARLKFVDRDWGADDLELVAEFWLRLYEAADHPSGASRESQQTLELTLTGLPRSATASVSSELVRRFGEANFSADLSTADPDTLIVKTKPHKGDRPAFPGLGIHTLAGALFDGLLIEIRYTVADAGAVEPTPELVGARRSPNQRRHFYLGAVEPKPELVGAALVIVGELRGGTVSVKAVWAEPAFVPLDFWNQVANGEQYILEGFDHYRESAKVDRALAHNIFNDLLRQNRNLTGVYRRFWQWLTDVPFGQPRLPGLLARCAAFGIALPILAFLRVLVCGENVDWLRVPFVILTIAWLCFLGKFAATEAQTFLSEYSPRRVSHDTAHRDPDRYTLLDAEAASRLNDIAVRKFTAELIEAGFIHVGDAASIPVKRANTFYRIFHAPDGSTYLTLICGVAFGPVRQRGHFWPVRVSFECQTFFSNGDRVDSLNHDSHTSRAPNATNRLLAFPTATDPLSLYNLHLAAVEAFAQETSAIPLRHEPLEPHLRRQDVISEEECRGYAKRPYSWRDHLRWYLQLDAPKPVKSG